MKDENLKLHHLHDNYDERDWTTSLNRLEEKARQGKADRQEFREIFLLRTLLHRLPPHLWWQSEV